VDFTAALEVMLSDATLRDAMGKRAQRRSLDFSWEASALAFEAVLRRTVEQARAQKS
jgi:glycosyltransferase involved in cell wall biosynthesis